jgi:hypothetical protein
MLINYRQVAEDILATHDSPASQIDALAKALEKAEEDGWRTALKHIGEQLRELSL